MGLTVYYRYKIKTDAEGARRLVRKLHAYAKKLPFDSVSEVEEYDPPDGKYAFTKGELDGPWKPGGMYMTRKRDDGEEESVHVPGLHVVSFRTDVEGSETASFGLASHPPVVAHREDVIVKDDKYREERRIGAGAPIEFPTRLRGWYSCSQFCKTQYAANPKHGGIENFLKAHLSIFRMVDECKRLGMTTHIRDDANFWRHRDEKKLVAELRRWDEIIAAFVGKVSDVVGSDPGRLVAPIKERPDFEHLEAKGDTRFKRAAEDRKEDREEDGKRLKRARRKREKPDGGKDV